MTSLDLDRLAAVMADVHVAELVTRPAWQADALCAEHPEVSFFPQRGEPTEPAKAICGRCLVRSDCLEYALATDYLTLGIWGGTSERERRKLRRGGSAA